MINHAERITSLRTAPLGEALVQLGVYLTDLEPIIQEYRSIERALTRNIAELRTQEQVARLQAEIERLAHTPQE